MHSTQNPSRLGKRRRFCAVLAAALLRAMGAHAQESVAAYPARPVRVVVAFTAGGTTDLIARSVGQQLADKLKQSFVIDNKPGGGNIGTEFVVRAPPDGYTLIVNTVGPMAVNPTRYKKLAYNPLTDLVPVVMIADVPNVLVVHPSVPAATLDDFTTYAKGTRGSSATAPTASALRRICPVLCWPGVPGLTPPTFPTKASMRSTICCPAGCSSCSPPFPQ